MYYDLQRERERVRERTSQDEGSTAENYKGESENTAGTEPGLEGSGVE